MVAWRVTGTCTVRYRYVRPAGGSWRRPPGVDGGIKSGLVLRACGRDFLLCFNIQRFFYHYLSISLSLYLSISLSFSVPTATSLQLLSLSIAVSRWGCTHSR